MLFKIADENGKPFKDIEDYIEASSYEAAAENFCKKLYEDKEPKPVTLQVLDFPPSECKHFKVTFDTTYTYYAEEKQYGK